MQPTPRRDALAGLEALEAQLDARSTATAPPPPAPDAPPLRPARGSLVQRIRTIGPLVSLVPPAILGLVSVVALAGSTSTVRGVIGFAAGVLAAPLLPAVGVPFRAGSLPFLIGIVASLVLWLAIGAVAAARATRTEWTSWGRFWRAWLRMAACAWLGMLLALVVANLVLGRALI